MKTFLIKIVLFSLPFIIFYSIWFLFYGVPPPQVSSSLSLNTKIHNIVNSNIKRPKILAIGSSMALNNLHSNTIKEHFGDSYFNISSWGQNMEENYKLMKVFAKSFNTELIIISSNIMDFVKSNKEIDYQRINEFYNGKRIPSLNYTSLKQSREYYEFRKDSKHYTSLKYDINGGVNFESVFFINNERWAGNPVLSFKLDEKQYNYLDSISTFCKENDIILLFVQSPFRRKYFLELKPKEVEALNGHINRIDSFLSEREQYYINTSLRLWNDSLFVDYSHFTEYGSKQYTDYFIKIYKRYEILSPYSMK